ncbi:MAG: asparagine synthase (glutamine-hydrolyzing) [Opitutaceae bacterium]|nr:asparagine synthase (glutamine-hydrolyzing) [Opitutaceae bacterium]
MCGILFTNRPGIEREEFLAALATMQHRGPDSPGGYARLGDSQLGHNRLSVVDLNPRSDQPFWSRDRRHVIVFNGEIYNYRELARAHGIVLRTGSDTELLLELWQRHGQKMLGWLYGMFAFVILDTVTGETFVARDRLGVKPLYVHESDEGVIVASELAAILQLVPDAAVDAFAVRQYRAMRGFFGGRTLYQGIEMFPAGCFARNGKITRFWSLPEGPQAPPEDDELDALLRSAVDYRLIADVPVGSYLSGGLDSSIIAALAQRSHTWVTGLPDENEFLWAAQAARHLGTEHRAIVVTPGRFPETAREMIAARREPLAVPNEVLLFEMTRAVKTKNTVVLSGEGADELFAGYDRIFRWAGESRAWDLREFARRYCYGGEPDLEVVEDAVAPFVGRGEPFAIVSAFFQIAHLHGLLRRLDNATMLCGVEGRVPFVDHRLVERLAGVPLDYKMAAGVVKAPLKRVFGHLLPPAIVNRPKVGFPVNLDRVLPRGGSAGTGTAMDRWFDFNLSALGLETDPVIPACT